MNCSRQGPTRPTCSCRQPMTMSRTTGARRSTSSSTRFPAPTRSSWKGTSPPSVRRWVRVCLEPRQDFPHRRSRMSTKTSRLQTAAITVSVPRTAVRALAQSAFTASRRRLSLKTVWGLPGLLEMAKLTAVLCSAVTAWKTSGISTPPAGRSIRRQWMSTAACRALSRPTR